MTKLSIFTLPDLGEGLQDAEIVNWLVAVGEQVALDQPLVALETAKAIVEVPSPFAGKIKQLHGQAGEVIPIGAALVEFELTDSTVSNSDSDVRDTGTVAGTVAVGSTVVHEPIIIRQTATPQAEQAMAPIKAIPAVRALAQRLNIDLAAVTPTGPGGVITAADVERTAAEGQPPRPEGNAEAEALKGTRRVMAQVLSAAYAEVVPVTLSEDAILSPTRAYPDITIDIILALITACKEEPALNAWYHSNTNARQLFSEVNLGIAMDSPEGLRVPVIKNAETCSAAQLRSSLDHYKVAVANKSITPAHMQGASIVLSNFGKFTGRYANPLVVPPTVAILGCGQWRKMPVVVEDKVVIRTVLPLSLTVDHRVITGGEAARFLNSLIQALVADK